jgi:ubiquinone/menaquinone biosynthesis C-methylase UbiE
LGGGANPRFRPNVDCRMIEGKVDIVADLNKPLTMIGSEEYDIVYCQYGIEHLSWRTVKGFIAELYRICAYNGMVIVITANLLNQCKRAIEEESKGNWEMVSCMIFGGQDYLENAHACGFSPSYIKKLFEDVGFVNVVVSPLQGCDTDLVLECMKGDLR